MMGKGYHLFLCLLLYWFVAFTAAASIERSAEPIGKHSVKACLDGCNRSETCYTGEYAGDPDHCQRYYYCHDRQWFLYYCGDDFYFNGEYCVCDSIPSGCMNCGKREEREATKTLVTKEGFKESERGNNHSLGQQKACVDGCNRAEACNPVDYAADPFDCTKYYYCPAGEWIERTCDEGFVFSATNCFCITGDYDCLQCDGTALPPANSTTSSTTPGGTSESTMTTASGSTASTVSSTSGGTGPTQSTTTEAASDRLPPQYQIILNGNFTSSTGEDFDVSCIQQYNSLMNDRVQEMGTLTINGLIGSTLCSTLTRTDIFVVSTSSSMVFDGNRGTAIPTFQLLYVPALYISDVESCAEEIGDYLAPHANWGLPILPPLPSCPGVEFTENTFNQAGDRWVCFGQRKVAKREIQDAGPLEYKISHEGSMATSDGESVNPTCSVSYSTEFYISTVDMTAATNNLISSGQLCAGHSDVILLTPSTSLVFEGSRGISTQDYFLELSADMAFSEVYECADELSGHLSSHSNWVTPIIPQVPGCPTINFDPEEFTETANDWICE